MFKNIYEANLKFRIVFCILHSNMCLIIRLCPVKQDWKLKYIIIEVAAVISANCFYLQ